MSLFKKFDAFDASDIENRLEKIEKKLEQMECSHNEFEFVSENYSYDAFFWKECKNCGKKIYSKDRKEWLKSQLKEIETTASQLSDEIKKV